MVVGQVSAVAQDQTLGLKALGIGATALTSLTSKEGVAEVYKQMDDTHIRLGPDGMRLLYGGALLTCCLATTDSPQAGHLHASCCFHQLIVMPSQASLASKDGLHVVRLDLSDSHDNTATVYAAIYSRACLSPHGSLNNFS